jgi:multicomponent Na+:H+ antiporter subunit D
MSAHAPILCILIPFLTALFVCLAGRKYPLICLPLTLLALLASLVAASSSLMQAVQHDSLNYYIAGWAPPFGIHYRVDILNGLVLIVVAATALLAAVYSHRSLPKEFAETPSKIPLYYTLYLLLATGLLGMTITADAFNLYVLLEISSLTTYALIAIRQGRAVMACFQYIMMGTIGASFYLLGVGYLYIKTGTLNMLDIHEVIMAADLIDSTSIKVAFILILVGVWIKMAFFPLHGWLPNAYTFSPSSTGAVLAPLMTKVTIYVMLRMMLTVFGMDYLLAINWSGVIVALASIAIIAGSVFALAQRDLKKMLCYLIISEVGYMVGGAWLLNEPGMTGAIYHIIADALMTLCLFLAAGAIIFKTEDHDFDALPRLFARMPLTMTGFTVGALSMIGLPPTCGFVSKWYLVKGGIAAAEYGFVAALIAASLINAVLFFRLFEIAYFKADGQDERPVERNEAPGTMLAPLLTVSLSLILAGLFNGPIISIIQQFVAGVLP